MLENINEPKDLQGLSIHKREKLADEIRTFLVDSISKTGGHLGSNLGIVELTIALHYNFNSPIDKIIFDVGHQGYVHKILTGRREMFDTLRQYNGLSGFLKMNESEHDVWEAGHSSTSISAACGFAMSRDVEMKDNHVIAVIGDGSMTNGMSLEALNHLVELQTKTIIILNDNEMSISSNVGFINAILCNLEDSEHYKTTKTKVRNHLSESDFGSKLAEVISVSKKRFKQEIQSDAHTFFKVLGFDYIGTVDGHDFKLLDEALIQAKQSENSVIVHVKTEKGKGYKPAEQYKWHGVGPFDISTGKPLTSSSGMNHSRYISELVIKKMEEDKDIVVITPAMLDGSELTKMKERFPNRVTDVGIAEEHGVTLAAALALDGKKPFMSIYSTFLQRGYDQVFHDVVRQNANVVIGIDRAGLVGADGETHQGIYDVSFLSHMHGMTICQGYNAEEIASLTDYAFKYDGPIAIRYARGGSFSNDDITVDRLEITHGMWRPLIENENPELVIISYGPILNNVLQVAEKFTGKVDVINSLFIKPLNDEMLLKYKDTKMLIVEEHTDNASLHSMIVKWYNDKQILKLVNKANLGDRFIEQGSISELYNESKLDVDSLLKQVENIVVDK